MARVIDKLDQLPINLDGDQINVQYCHKTGRAWVCVDGVSVLRVRGLKTFCIEGEKVEDPHVSDSL